MSREFILGPISKPRKITPVETEEILKIKSEDITITLILNLFAPTRNSDQRFLVNDYFTLPTSRFNTKKEVTTTVGIYIANLHLIMHSFSETVGYINKPFDGGVIRFIEDKLSDALYIDKITTDQMADYYDRLQWLGGHDAMSFLSPTITPALMKPAPGLMDLKRELFEKYKDELDENNPNNAKVASEIETTLIKEAEKYLKTQEGYENFASKSKINIANNYKTMNIMKGPLKNSYTGKYRINSSEYNSGIKKDEYASLGDSAVIGAHARAVETAKGGYLAKQVTQANNTLMTGPKGSDCQTKKYLDVHLTKSVAEQYLNRFILGKKGELIELTFDNIANYYDTVVQMRSPMYCVRKEPEICNICAGNQPFIIGPEKFGLAMFTVPNKLMYKSMKKFHDMTIKLTKIDPDKLFYEVEDS